MKEVNTKQEATNTIHKPSEMGCSGILSISCSVNGGLARSYNRMWYNYDEVQNVMCCKYDPIEKVVKVNTVQNV